VQRGSTEVLLADAAVVAVAAVVVGVVVRKGAIQAWFTFLVPQMEQGGRA